MLRRRNARYGPAPNAAATTPNALTSWTASSARNWAGVQCCVDEHKHTVTCAFCCDDSDCNRENCEVCHGGYCLTCFDQTDGHAPICAFQCVVPVSESDNKSDFCVQCCFDEQCGPCERCRDGWCEFVCDDHERCCRRRCHCRENLNGGFCAECCGSEDCGGDCERCLEGSCVYPCEREICCHGDFCAHEEEGCCGLPGDWCEIDIVNTADANLNGSCCGEPRLLPRRQDEEHDLRPVLP